MPLHHLKQNIKKKNKNYSPNKNYKKKCQNGN